MILLAGVGRADEVAAALGSACHDIAVPAIAGAIDDRQAAAVLALPPGAGQDQVLTRLAARLRRGGALVPADAAGVGPAAASIADARDALHAAAQAAGAAARLAVARLGSPRLGAAAPGPGPPASGRPFASLADLRLAGLLYQLRDDPRVLAFAERELGALLRRDEQAGTDLTGVLAAYLDAGGNKAAAAHRAGLARPTLYERLRQIEQVCRVSLETPASRLALHAALIIRTLGSG